MESFPFRLHLWAFSDRLPWDSPGGLRHGAELTAAAGLGTEVSRRRRAASVFQELRRSSERLEAATWGARLQNLVSLAHALGPEQSLTSGNLRTRGVSPAPPTVHSI